jgi:beta-carotene hydroxylase
MHGIAHRNRRINAALGRLASLALMLPYPLFRAAHHSHHGHTNDPLRDPDLIVARRPSWLRPVWFLLTPLNYRKLVYGDGMLRSRAARIEAFGSEAAIVAIIAGAALTGGMSSLLQLWLVPATAAIFLLAFAFDLLPHHPHTTQARYYDTRIYPSRVLNVLLLGQNYHLIHHLWTTIPWYHYERAFREVEPDLLARGAPIGWKSRAELPSA